jgi:hypothetical protein
MNQRELVLGMFGASWLLVLWGTFLVVKVRHAIADRKQAASVLKEPSAEVVELTVFLQQRTQRNLTPTRAARLLARTPGTRPVPLVAPIAAPARVEQLRMFERKLAAR